MTNIIAHRGAWKEFNLPQNSIASLKKAIELKCFGSEFDVHLTQDEIAVVNHDYDFYGMDIATNEYKKLLTKKHPNGEPIPTLKQYLEAGCYQHQTRLILEIKTSNHSLKYSKKMIDVILESVSQYAYSECLEFILFDYEAAVYLKKKAKYYCVHYLNGDKTAQEIKVGGLDGMDYNYKLLSEDKTIINSFRELNLKTNSWTVNEWNIAEYLIRQKIDCLTTDYPKMFIEKMQQFNL